MITDCTSAAADVYPLVYDLGRYEAQLRVQAAKVADAYDKYARQIAHVASTLPHLTVSAQHEALLALQRQSHRMEKLLGENALQHFQAATRSAFVHPLITCASASTVAKDATTGGVSPGGHSPGIQLPHGHVRAVHPRSTPARSVEARNPDAPRSHFGFAVADLSCLSHDAGLLSIVTTELQLPLISLPATVTHALRAVRTDCYGSPEEAIIAACDAMSAALGSTTATKTSRWIVVASVEDSKAWHIATAKLAAAGEMEESRRPSLAHHRFLVRSADDLVSMLSGVRRACVAVTPAPAPLPPSPSWQRALSETNHSDAGVVDLTELLATIESASTPSSSIVRGADLLHCAFPSTLPESSDINRCPGVPAVAMAVVDPRRDPLEKVAVVPPAPRFARKRSRSLGTASRASRRHLLESQRVEFEQLTSDDEDFAVTDVGNVSLPRGILEVAAEGPEDGAEVHHRFQMSSTVRAMRKEIGSYIDALKGELCAAASYQSAATHLIVAEATTERTEKYLCFCASGKSIVSCRYLRDSAEHSEWLSLRLGSKGSDLYELSPYRRRYHRLCASSSSAGLVRQRLLGRIGALPLPFAKWRVVLFASRAVASSIATILASGGCTSVVCDGEGEQDRQWVPGKSCLAAQQQSEYPQWLQAAAAAAVRSPRFHALRSTSEEAELHHANFDNATRYLSSDEHVTHILVECSLRDCRFEAPLALPTAIAKDAALMRQKVFSLEILYQVLCREAHEEVFSVHTGCLLPGARERLPMSCQVFCADAVPSDEGNRTSTATADSTISAPVD